MARTNEVAQAGNADSLSESRKPPKVSVCPVVECNPILRRPEGTRPRATRPVLPAPSPPSSPPADSPSNATGEGVVGPSTSGASHWRVPVRPSTSGESLPPPLAGGVHRRPDYGKKHKTKEETCAHDEVTVNQPPKVITKAQEPQTPLHDGVLTPLRFVKKPLGPYK